MQDTFNTFSETAKKLAGSPLQILALFLVLIYGLACLVIGLGGEKLQNLGHHPLVYFLALFPCLVLAAFTWLVAKYHWKLYGLSEFKDESNFVILVQPPKELPKRNTGLALSDASLAVALPGDIEQRIDAKYNALLQEGYRVIHATEVVRQPTAPGNGLFRVRVWIEGDQDPKLGEIETVTYRVWHDFPQTQITTSDRINQFDVWLSVNGEFPILAFIRLKGGQEIWQLRYLDLPGRPQDP
jgi:hypothetical protein